MVGARVLHVRREEVEHLAFGENLLDALIKEQLAAEPSAIRQDGIGPFVVGLVAIEMLREQHVLDSGRRTQLSAAERRALRGEMMRLADGSAVPEVVATVAPEAALQNVVRVERRGLADHAAAAVTLEDGLPEAVASEQWVCRGHHRGSWVIPSSSPSSDLRRA